MTIEEKCGYPSYTPTNTPEVFAAYPDDTGVPGSHYFKGIGGIVDGKILNFNNKDDFALRAWEINQDTKPDIGWGYGLGRYGDAEYNQTSFDVETWYRHPYIFEPAIELLFPEDRYEIFAHIAEARSRALGKEPATDNEITGNVDLKVSLGYTDAPEDHSGQFRSTYNRRQEYYDRLLTELGIN